MSKIFGYFLVLLITFTASGGPSGVSGFFVNRPVASSSSFPQAASLIAYYKLDESSGTRVDQTANALDLTDNGTISVVAGKINNAVSNNNSSLMYLSRSSNALYTATGGANWSIGMWLNINTASAGYSPASYWNWSGNNGGWSLVTGTGSSNAKLQLNIAATLASAAGENAIISGAVPLNQWVYFLWCYDGSQGNNTNRIVCYTNGVNATLTFAGTLPVAMLKPNAQFQLANWTSRGAFGFAGNVDEVAIWAATLSASDATTLYNGGAGITYP